MRRGKWLMKYLVLASLIVAGFLAAAAISSDRDGWWGANGQEVKALVRHKLQARSVDCERTKSGENVQRWRCSVTNPTGISIVRIYRDGAVSALGRGVPGFAIGPS